MKQQIAKFLDLDIEDLKELTTEQKKYLRAGHHNLWDMPQYYTDSYLIFTSEGTVKHWQYYAGFEYLPDPEVRKRGDSYICAYCTDNDSDNRIQDIIDELNEALTA